MTHAMLNEVKARLAKVVNRKLDEYDKCHAEPEVPEEILKRIEQEQRDWQVKRDKYAESVKRARDKFFDRIVFDHENAMLLIRDFESLEISSSGAPTELKR